MENLLERITALTQNRNQSLENISTIQDFEKVHILFLGRNGKIAELMESLKTLPLEEKKQYGPLLNALKIETQDLFNSALIKLQQQAREQELTKQKNFDVSAYRYRELKGSTHIYTQIVEDLENIFISMGYDIIDGPEVENEYHNFDSLNIPTGHPARE